jgi:hypothetical protein
MMIYRSPTAHGDYPEWEQISQNRWRRSPHQLHEGEALRAKCNRSPEKEKTMRNTRPQCYEIPTVYVAMAIKRAIERKGTAGPRGHVIPSSMTRQIERVNSGEVTDVRQIVAPAPSKRLFSKIKLMERPKKIA